MKYKYCEYEIIPKETPIYAIFYEDYINSQITQPILGKFVEVKDYLENPFIFYPYKFEPYNHKNNHKTYGKKSLYADTYEEALELRNKIIKARINKIIEIANKGE